MKLNDWSTVETFTETSGYSIVELIVVLAGLSVLTSISLVGLDGQSGILGAVKFAEIDEAKALLNKAASDCLQKGRIGGSNKDLIDEEIISDIRINPIGFKINKADNADKCSYFQLIPSKEDDDVRYPIGFSVIDGSLSKFATPTSTNKGSISSCERWAGVNCKQDESLKKLVEWKNKIAAEKTKCEANYSNWLTNTQPLQFKRWNPNADSACPDRPPKDGSTSYRTDPNCTPNGCNRVVFGLDGEFVGFTREDYDRALETKYGKACTDWVAEQKAASYTNSLKTLSPLTKSPECGSQKFWFFEGEDQGTKDKFLETACSAWLTNKSKQAYTNDPINEAKTTPECKDQKFWFLNGVDYKTQEQLNIKLLESASGKCELDRERDRAAGFTGQWGPKPGPGVCAEESYICDGKIVDAFNYAKDCGEKEGPPDKCKERLMSPDQDCIDFELGDYWYKKCGPRPKLPKPCSTVGKGSPGKGWAKTNECAEWAKCMSLF